MTNKVNRDDPITLDEYRISKFEETEAQEVELMGDDAYANRMLQELASIEKQVKANSDIAQFERSKITDWEGMVNGPLQTRALWLRDNLSAYALNERTTSDRKTIRLPFGTLSTTAEQPKWTVDNDVFIDWARGNMLEAVRTKFEPVMAELKSKAVIDSDGNAVYMETGEAIPGVTATTGISYKASVKTN